MTTKLAFMLLMLVVGCGERKVVFPDSSAQEENTFITKAGQLQLDQTGSFTKKQTLNSSTITVGGKAYPFSEYSSNQALTWYAGKSMGSVSQVQFRGELISGKIIVERIQDI